MIEGVVPGSGSCGCSGGGGGGDQGVGGRGIGVCSIQTNLPPPGQCGTPGYVINPNDVFPLTPCIPRDNISI